MAKASLSKATATPIEFELNGQIIELHPLRFRDWGRIEQWMRTQIINATVESLRDTDFTEAEKRQIIRLGQEEAGRISLTKCLFGSGIEMLPDETQDQFRERLQKTGVSRDRAVYLDTFEGMLRIVHLSARDVTGKTGRPRFSLDKLDELLNNDYDSLVSMYEIAMTVSLPDVEVIKEAKEKISEDSEKKAPTAAETAETETTSKPSSAD